MAKPTPSDLHVNALLGDLSVAFFQRDEDFVADRVFPNVPVKKQSDRYATYLRGSMWRNSMKPRAPGTESAGIQHEVDTSPTYYCDRFGVHEDITDDQRDNQDSVFDMDRDATEVVTLAAKINREVAWASRYFAQSVWTTDIEGDATPTGAQVLQWNDANSNPIQQVDDAKYTQEGLVGRSYSPNTLVLGRRAYKALRNHPALLERVKYSGSNNAPAKVTLAMIAEVMELERVMVCGGVLNEAEEGATDSFDWIVGADGALLCYAAPSPGLRKPSAGYTFVWTGKPGVGPTGTRIKKFRMEPIESDRIEIDSYYDQKVIAADLGVFFRTIVA